MLRNGTISARFVVYLRTGLVTEPRINEIKRILTLLKRKMPTNKILQTLIVLGPTIPYFDQAIKINRVKSAAGFSPSVCYILLASAVFKIAFWYTFRCIKV